MEEQEIGRVRETSEKESVVEESIPYLLCIFANICHGGMTIVSKVSLDQGMSRYVLVVYGFVFGTIASAPLALIFERKNNSKISLLVLRNVFFLSLLGVVGRTLYFVGLEWTSPTFASAMNNIIPSITFLLAIVCRMERVNISKLSAQAKIVGTAVAFSGAVLMTIYKGITLISIGYSLVHAPRSHQKQDKDWIKGSLMLLLSCFSFSAFYIIQTKTIKMYPKPITFTSLTCFIEIFISTIMTAIMDHKAASWRLSWNITLLAPLYTGVVIFAISFYVQTLVTRKRGPVFMSAFSPLSTIIVAVMGLFLLGEALHLGSIVGAVLIILGLYAILWGKEKEKNPSEHKAPDRDKDIEIVKFEN